MALVVALMVILAFTIPAILWDDWRNTLLMIGAAIVATLIFRTWADKHRELFGEDDREGPLST